MRRLRIKHVTGFRYPSEVAASYNEARMQPCDGDDQFLLHWRLDISPPASRDSYVDYWGTNVTSFEVVHGHTELTLRAEALVEIADREHHPGELDWPDLHNIGDRSLTLSEQLHPTAHTTPPGEVTQIAEEIRERSSSPAHAARQICETIGRAIDYRTDTTEVSDTAVDVWAHRSGVCQDVAHVTLSALRSVGIPARYVSGYFQPKGDAGIGEEVPAESHAWIEWYCGQWTGFDPTNSSEIGERYVIVGRGRDYTDVSPLRGLYAGAAGADLFVEVTLTREL